MVWICQLLESQSGEKTKLREKDVIRHVVDMYWLSHHMEDNCNRRIVARLMSYMSAGSDVVFSGSSQSSSADAVVWLFF